MCYCSNSREKKHSLREPPSSIPFKEEQVKEYERRRYRAWDQKLVDAREKKILKRILQLTGVKQGRVLDVPCGYGRFSSLFLPSSFKLINCDLSYSMVRRAQVQSNSPCSSLGVVGDLKNSLPFKPFYFSLVLSMRFFHHLHQKKEREHVLGEFFRVSSRWVVVSFYKRNFLHSIHRKFRKRIKKSPTRISMISGEEFEQQVRRVGFKVIGIFPLVKGLHAQHIALLEK